MTEWQTWIRVALILSAFCGLPCLMFRPRKRKRSLDDLFHPSHTPLTPEPEPIKIDWDVMRSRRVK